MTAQILHTLPPPLGCTSHSRSTGSTTARETSVLRKEPPAKWLDASHEKGLLETSSSGKAQPTPLSTQESFWAALMNSLPQGVIVISRSLQTVYSNRRAKELCQSLVDVDQRVAGLPSAILEVCHRLLRGNTLNTEPLVVECLNNLGQSIRFHASWFSLPSSDRDSASDPAYILIRLENCYETLQEELRIERKKYDLTDREAEIWMLLRQECTYQTIAKALQISLNTVKTHVKNLYAKKRSFQGQEKIVVF